MKWVLLAISFSAFTALAQKQPALPIQDRTGLVNQTELGLNVANGNSRSQNYNFKQSSSYLFTADSIRLNGHYTRLISDEAESARNWDVSLRYDRGFSRLWSIFFSEGAEGDPYAGIEDRYNTDLGAKYYVQRVSALTWFLEGGYRHTEEHDIDESVSLLHYVRVYSETEKKWAPNLAGKIWLEYLENVKMSEDFKFNGEISISSKVSDNLDLKTSYSLRFNNIPPRGALYKADTFFMTSLVFKL